VAKERAKVPGPVSGEPDTENTEGAVKIMLEMPPGGVVQVPLPLQYVLEVAPEPLFKFVTGRFPLTPPLPAELNSAGGTSAPTIARRPTAPLLPFGVARN
jgi:hypothetical protein